MQSIAQVAADKNFFVRMGANLLIRRYKTQPIVQMTAKEFMFGYETELTTMGNTLTPNWITFSKVGLIDRVCFDRQLKINLSMLIEFDKLWADVRFRRRLRNRIHR